MKILPVIAFLLLGTAALTGCNTTEGVGEDLEEVGEDIKDASR